VLLDPGGDRRIRVVVELVRQAGDAAVQLDVLVRLVPARQLSLDQSLEFLREDECVEVTPKTVRLRKLELTQNDRVTAIRWTGGSVPIGQFRDFGLAAVFTEEGDVAFHIKKR